MELVILSDENLRKHSNRIQEVLSTHEEIEHLRHHPDVTT